MERTLPRPLDWRLPLAVGLGIVLAVGNVLLAWDSIVAITRQEPGDWRILVDASRAANPYVGQPYVWSPLAAPLLSVLELMGPDLWRFLHVSAALAFPTWRMRAIVLASYPFWFDVNTGNILVFVALLGVYALRGHRWAGWAFLVGTMLVPKPQFAIIAAWLLWKHPEYRKPLLWVVPIYALLVLSTGYAFDWLTSLPGASHDIANPYQFLPSRIIGAWWLVIGLPLAGWLAWKDHPGWASIVGSLYAGAPQLLLLTVERSPRSDGTPHHRAGSIGR